LNNIPFWGAFILRLLNCTLRWQWIGFSGEEQQWTSQKPRIMAFWHGRQIMMPFVYLNIERTLKTAPMTVLSSEHRDGRLMAAILNRLGIKSIYGSSTHGGRAALFGMIHAAESGSHLAMTPDGPKGPVFAVKEGIIRMAQRSGSPIYPLGIGFTWAWKFSKSWDSMLLPLPFSRVVVMMGTPILVPRKLTIEQIEGYREQLEATLNQLTTDVDALVAI
jgi:lysophospholipid acyltransferase (LPLAT)-like uncharacterized protein